MSRGKILYGGPIDPGSTARHRMMALERLGYEIVPFNFADYLRGTRSEEHTSELQSLAVISYAVSLDRKSVV